MKRTVKNHKPKNRHSREENNNHRRSTKDEKMVNKYGPVCLMIEEDDLDEDEE